MDERMTWSPAYAPLRSSAPPPRSPGETQVSSRGIAKPSAYGGREAPGQCRAEKPFRLRPDPCARRRGHRRFREVTSSPVS